MANPVTIMGAAALSYFDVAESGLFQNSDGTGAVADTNPVGYMPDQVTGTFTAPQTAWRPTYRANAGDPYLEGNLSLMRRPLSRSGTVYTIHRVRHPQPQTNETPHTFVMSTNELSFYNGTQWFTQKVLDFGIGLYLVENADNPVEVDDAGELGNILTVETYFDGTNAAIALNGGAFVTAASTTRSSEYYDLFGGRDGASNLDGSVGEVDMWRGAILNAIPDSTERTALLDWATNGDVGGGSVTGTGAGTNPAQTGTGTGERTVTGTGAGTNPAQTGTGTGERTVTGTGAGTNPAQTGTGEGTRFGLSTGTGAGTNPAQTGTGTGERTVTGTGAGTNPAQTGTGEGTTTAGEATGTGSGINPAQTGTGTGERTVTGSGAGVSPSQVGQGTGRRLIDSEFFYTDTETATVLREPREVTLDAEPRFVLVGSEQGLEILAEPRVMTVQARKRTA